MKDRQFMHIYAQQNHRTVSNDLGHIFDGVSTKDKLMKMYLQDVVYFIIVLVMGITCTNICKMSVYDSSCVVLVIFSDFQFFQFWCTL